MAILAQVVDIRRGFLRLGGTVRCHLEQAKEVHSNFAESLCYLNNGNPCCCSQFDVGPCDPVVGSEAQSGLMKGDYSVIDYSMQCGSFDVGVSLHAACSSAASSVVPATCCRRVPRFLRVVLPSSAELRLYPVFCFQSWNVDCVICYLSPEMVSCWTFYVCFLDPGLFQLDPEWLFGSPDGDCGLRTCRRHLCRDESVDSGSLLRHCGCARSVFPWTNQQLERLPMSSWSVWCKQQLHWQPLFSSCTLCSSWTNLQLEAKKRCVLCLFGASSSCMCSRDCCSHLH